MNGNDSRTRVCTKNTNLKIPGSFPVGTRRKYAGALGYLWKTWARRQYSRNKIAIVWERERESGCFLWGLYAPARGFITFVFDEEKK